MDINDLGARFEACAIRKDEWTHAAHLVVGLWHVHRYGADDALARLRAGIRRLNENHGGVNSAMGLTSHSTWKYNVPHGQGVHHAMTPDPYRGLFGRSDPDAGRKYAADVAELIRMATPGKVAAFFPSDVTPESKQLRDAIDAALAR